MRACLQNRYEMGNERVAYRGEKSCSSVDIREKVSRCAALGAPVYRPMSFGERHFWQIRKLFVCSLLTPEPVTK